MKQWGKILALLGAMTAYPVQADVIEISGHLGKPLIIELVWENPVDLDLFLTDPTGETVYFANRISKSGVRMGLESGCSEVSKNHASYGEIAKIEKALLGRYRVSVDFIKDCGNTSLDAEFEVILKNKEGDVIDSARSSVQYRLLNPVGWEFRIK